MTTLNPLDPRGFGSDSVFGVGFKAIDPPGDEVMGASTGAQGQRAEGASADPHQLPRTITDLRGPRSSNCAIMSRPLHQIVRPKTRHVGSCCTGIEAPFHVTTRSSTAALTRPPALTTNTPPHCQIAAGARPAPNSLHAPGAKAFMRWKAHKHAQRFESHARPVRPPSSALPRHQRGRCRYT